MHGVSFETQVSLLEALKPCQILQGDKVHNGTIQENYQKNILGFLESLKRLQEGLKFPLVTGCLRSQFSPDTHSG